MQATGSSVDVHFVTSDLTGSYQKYDHIRRQLWTKLEDSYRQPYHPSQTFWIIFHQISYMLCGNKTQDVVW